VLATEDLNHLKELASGLIYSPHRALGVIPLLPSSQAVRVLDQILEARDVLNLPPDDPFGDIVDERSAEHEEDDAKLRAARQSMDAKSGEVRELKEKLEGFQAEIARQEEKLAATAAAQPALAERHGERNRLRRELQKAHDDLESFRQSATASPAEEAAAARREDELLLPQSAPEVHPVRLADYPKHFLQTLEVLPRSVARGGGHHNWPAGRRRTGGVCRCLAAQGHAQRDAPAHWHQLPAVVPPLAGAAGVH